MAWCRNQFQQALEAVGIMESDAELLDILFSHMDRDDNDNVDFHEFVVSCSPMIRFSLTLSIVITRLIALCVCVQWGHRRDTVSALPHSTSLP